MIEVRTKIDMKTQKRINAFFLKRAFLNPLVIIVFGGMFVCGVLYLAFSDFSYFQLFAGLFLVLFPVIFPVAIIIIAKKAAKTNKILTTPIHSYYRFDADSFFAESSRDGVVISSTTIRYAELFKAMEFKQDFYLYQNQALMHFVPKADFVTGSPKELRQLLGQKLGKMFKSSIKN